MESAMNRPEVRSPIPQRGHLGFRGNLAATRYGWLRLTPAYSVHLVGALLDAHATAASRVLDPFCGTGTTALACAERGLACDTTDINPFLLWLAAAKTRPYTDADLAAFRRAATAVERAADGDTPAWTPPLHQIEKWWTPETLAALARIRAGIEIQSGAIPAAAVDLLKLAFCRALIETAHVSFGHQSMSFKKAPQQSTAADPVTDSFRRAAALLAESARTPILARPNPIRCDARALSPALPRAHYDCVITSPPYPNRMSYIRELRPYMYWLGHLESAKQAGDLDYTAIGGTWGTATSRVAKWQPPSEIAIPFAPFESLLGRIAGSAAKHGRLLARYVHKYFHDMTIHAAALADVVAPGGTIHHVVGNSKFYDVLLPVEEIFAALFAANGFERIEVRAIRKRTSKKELFEFVVSGTRKKESR